MKFFLEAYRFKMIIEIQNVSNLYVDGVVVVMLQLLLLPVLLLLLLLVAGVGPGGEGVIQVGLDQPPTSTPLHLLLLLRRGH